MFQDIYSIVGLAACCGVLALAIWKGGASEQAAAGFVAVAWGGTLTLQYLIRGYARWIPAIDVALLIGLGVIVWRSRKEWPLAALAFQGVIVATGAAYLLDLTLPYPIYVTAVTASTFGVLAAIVFGVWQTASRNRRAAPTL